MTTTNPEVKVEPIDQRLLSTLKTDEIKHAAALTADAMLKELEQRDIHQRIRTHQANLLKAGSAPSALFATRLMTYECQLGTAKKTYRKCSEEFLASYPSNHIPEEIKTVADFINWFVKSFQKTLYFQDLIMAPTRVDEVINLPEEKKDDKK